MKLWMVYRECWEGGGLEVDSIHTDFAAALLRGDEMNEPNQYVMEIESGKSYNWAWTGCPITECQYVPPPPPPPVDIDLEAMSPPERLLNDCMLLLQDQMRAALGLDCGAAEGAAEE